jgi:dolichol kinase
LTTHNPQKPYEWNSKRKLWHIAGCVIIILLFQLWKDVDDVVTGANVMIVFGWLTAGLLVVIDVVRLNFPEQQAIVEKLPFYGSMIREDERQHFNASTYLILAVITLVTLWRVGWLSEAAFLQAVAVVGLADPAAAWVRFVFWRRQWILGRLLGLLVFVVVAAAMMIGVCLWAHAFVNIPAILLIAALTAVVEGYVGRWVRLTQRLAVRAQEHLSPRVTVWLRRVYPDDNLLIPLMVALLSEVLSRIS